LGAFNIILIDEAHMIPGDGEGMYRQFLADMKVINPKVRVVGLTATPYRLKSGMICAPDNILNYVCYEVGVKELISRGYLCSLRSKAGLDKSTPDVSGVNKQAGEYNLKELGIAVDRDEVVESAVNEIIQYSADRKATLIFATSIEHGHHIEALLKFRGLSTGYVTGSTPSEERAQLIANFKSGSIKYMVNVNVLTTGFDAPHIDCIAMLRPTLSPGLYYQMCGRGFRICDGKADCLVLDFAGNIVTHGPVDLLRDAGERKEKRKGNGSGDAPAKECPKCRELLAAAFRVCTECLYEFPEPEIRHSATAGSDAPISETTYNDYEVLGAECEVHFKKDYEPGDPRSVRIDYKIGMAHSISEWVCPEHTGFARKKFEGWWKMRSALPAPTVAEDVVLIFDVNGLPVTKSITVKETTGNRFPEIAAYKLKSGWDFDAAAERAAMALEAPDVHGVVYDEEEIPF